MKNIKYVWIIDGDFRSKSVFRFPCQIRNFALRNGFSICDEIHTDIDTIVFFKKDEYGREIGFYAARRKIA